MLKPTPHQIADVLVDNGVAPQEIPERLVFIESVGDDAATTEARTEVRTWSRLR